MSSHVSAYEREVEVCRHLARSVRLPFVDLRVYRISSGILRRMPLAAAERHRCVPLVFNRRRLVLVHENPADAFYLACRPEALGPELLARAPVRLEFALTTREALEETLERRRSLRGPPPRSESASS